MAKVGRASALPHLFKRNREMKKASLEKKFDKAPEKLEKKMIERVSKKKMGAKEPVPKKIGR